MRPFYSLRLSLGILARLWSGRDRPALLGREWWRAWAKRLQQLPTVFRQGRIHARVIARGARISPTAFISAPARISGNLKLLDIGDDSFVGGVNLAVHAPLWIGARVCINDGAQLLTATHDVTHPDWPTVARPIRLEDHAWVATNAIILPGVNIGHGAVAGAGAVVAADVPPLAIVAGNPARPLPKRRPSGLNYSPTSRLALFTAWCRVPPAESPPR